MVFLGEKRMVTNFFVACEVCGCTIRLRYQVSEVPCSIKFHCPECKTEISGSLQTIWHYGKESIEKIPWHYDLNLKNASEISVESSKYVLEISPDLSTNMISLDNNDPNQYKLSPFMRQAFLPEAVKNQNTRFYNFLQKWEKDWDNIKIKIDLCYNEKYNLLLSRFGGKYQDFPDEINCIMSVHQELIFFCAKILPKDILKDYTKIGKRLIKIFQNAPKEFNDFCQIYDLNYTKQLERKTLQLLKTFLDIYPKFLPVFNTLKIQECKDLGISTLTFEDIKTFYQDSYEIILYSLPRVVALNNIYCRKTLNGFVDKTDDFKKRIESYSSKVNIYKELISQQDEFSWLIDTAIENHIRNSIGHFNYEENTEKQTVLFIDDHKGKTKKETKTLMEISRECVNMFYTLVNLLELNYNILKIQVIERNHF